MQSLIFPIVRLQTKYWLPFLLVAVALGCSAEGDTTARTQTSDDTATGAAPVTSTALAPATTGCRLGELEAADHVSARCLFYDVYGLELAHVALQLAFGLRHPDRGTWHAAATWYQIPWSFDYIGPTPCRLTSSSVPLTLEYMLPRWKPPGRVDPAAVAEWNRYLGRLWEHERGHARNALAAAREIQSMLARLPAAPDCPRLELNAQAAADRILDRWNRENDAYDEATDGGAKTGAVLNP